jgi:hypothetical protein
MWTIYREILLERVARMCPFVGWVFAGRVFELRKVESLTVAPELMTYKRCPVQISIYVEEMKMVIIYSKLQTIN